MLVVRMVPFFAVVLSLLASAELAGACSCMPALPVRAELESSSAVFIGEVIAKREVDVIDGGHVATVGYTFRVYRAWKGVRTETVEIGTIVSGMSCGSHFFVGDEYLVYAGGDVVAGATSFFGGAVASSPDTRPSFWTSACSRTMPIGGSDRDLEKLGEPSFTNDAVEVSLLSDELRRACREGDTQAVRALIRAGHDVNGKDRPTGASAHRDTTPLMFGVPFHRRDVFEREERRRRDPEWIDPRLAIIELLLEAGADVDLTDQSGQTALARAEGVKAEAIAALLRDQMN